jgi:hypothetical protein
MTPRDRFRSIMRFEPFDRLPVIEWAGWWDKTLSRWYHEGLPQTLIEHDAIRHHFCLDVYQHAWLQPYGSVPRGPTRADRQAGILARTPDYDDARKMMYPGPNLDRVTWGHWADEQERGETVVWLQINGFFWFPREVLGVERHLYAFYDEPHLIHSVNTDLLAWNIRLLDVLCQICTPDIVIFAEDLSYNLGPMLSRACFDEFLAPYYRQILPLLKDREILSFIDSDGDITIPTGWFREVGIDGMLPLERQAGVDICVLRKEDRSLRCFGHFDKMTMDRGEHSIRAEFERLLPEAARGGFVIGCDHQTPPAVSYDAYKSYIALFKEYAREAGKVSQKEPKP